MIYFKKLCCFNLRTGGMIVGWLGLIMSIVLVCMEISSLVYLDNFAIPQNNGEIYIPEVTFILAIRRSSAAVVGTQIVALLMNSSLIYGIYKRKHLLLLPWMVMTVFSLSICVLVTLFCTVMLFYISFIEYGFLVLFTGGALFGIELYIWLCILSLFTEFKLIELQKRQGDEMSILGTIKNTIGKLKNPSSSFDPLDV